MSKIFDFFERKEKKKNLFGTELEDLVPGDCLIPTVISKEKSCNKLIIDHFSTVLTRYRTDISVVSRL